MCQAPFCLPTETLECYNGLESLYSKLESQEQT